MMLNGKRDNFTLDDFRECAKTVSMKRGRAETIAREVYVSVSRLHGGTESRIRSA